MKPYRPIWRHLLCDVIFFALAVLLFYLLKDYPVLYFGPRYGVSLLIICTIWIAAAYLVGNYRSMKARKYRQSAAKLLLTALLAAGVVAPLAALQLIEMSPLQILLLMAFVFVCNLLLVMLVHAVYYAGYLDETPKVYAEREPAPIIQAPYMLEEATIESIIKAITNQTTEQVCHYICDAVNVCSSNTLVLATTNIFNYESLRNYRYDAIVNVEKLNNVRGINRMFCMANEKLADRGKVIFCFESRATQKERLLAQWSHVIGWVFYCFLFVWKRIVPKLFLTNRLYYDITQGRNRVLTKTEVLGRLYYCGFEVLDMQVIDNYTVVVAQRATQPQEQLRRRYGPFIKLRRIGKDGKVFDVYKLRTMHPYAEYLQQYMYNTHHLREGGKIADDIRVSTLGHIARRCWLDELPMFINLLKGDMKLVGVRPLSNQYFNLYSKELQEKRTKFKPGLLPPFYADMPKTLDEIQDSEMRYLTMCEERGCFVTDNIYFWRILYNILIKKARSN